MKPFRGFCIGALTAAVSIGCPPLAVIAIPVCAAAFARKEGSDESAESTGLDMLHDDFNRDAEALASAWRGNLCPGEKKMEIERVIEERGRLGGVTERIVDRKTFRA